MTIGLMIWLVFASVTGIGIKKEFDTEHKTVTLFKHATYGYKTFHVEVQ